MQQIERFQPPKQGDWISARVSRPIPAPVADTFAFLADATNDTLWIDALASSRRLDSGDLQVGSQFQQVAAGHLGGVEVTWEIRELEKDRWLLGESISGNYRFACGYELEGDGGTTLVTKFAAFERRAMLLAVPRFLGDSLMRRYFETCLKVLSRRRWQ